MKLLKFQLCGKSVTHLNDITKHYDLAELVLHVAIVESILVIRASLRTTYD